MVRVSSSATVTTERLLLSPMAAGDLAELFPIFHDPQGWVHDPAGRHLTVATTAAFIERAAARWPTDGQSYWTVRLRSTGEVIGMGGVQRHSNGGWNLAYRIAHQHWGHGYATEVSLLPSRRPTWRTTPSRSSPGSSNQRCITPRRRKTRTGQLRRTGRHQRRTAQTGLRRPPARPGQPSRVGMSSEYEHPFTGLTASGAIGPSSSSIS